VGVQLLVSEASWRLLGERDAVTVHDAAVRGRALPVRMHVLA